MKIFTILLLVLPTFGNETLELKRLNKCYSIMARSAISSNHPLYVKVKSGEISGPDACMEVFNLAKLGDDGEIGKYSNASEKFTKFKSVIDSKCISCHSSGGNNLSTLTTEKDWINSKYITAGSIQNSLLFIKLKGAGITPFQETMPKNQSALSSDELKDIKDWIESIEIANFDLDNNGRSETAKNVLKTFNDFHRSWFSNFNMRSSSVGCTDGASEVLDSGEMAYFATRSLFSDRNYKDIVTSDDTLEAIRTSEYAPSNRMINNLSVTRKLIIGSSKGTSYADSEKFDSFDGPLIQRGLLVGITSRAPVEVNGLYNHRNLFEDPTSVNILDHMKAGAIGSAPYVIMNSGFTDNQLSNGALVVRRRWSRSVLNDVLCRDVPVIRSTDAIKYIDQEGSSPLSFRSGISCMQCHATMDPMARGLRNVRSLSSTNTCNSAYGYPFNYIHQVKPSIAEHDNEWTGWIDQADSNFYKRPPVGKFLFRSANGNLIDERFDSIDNLGNIIADTDDLYYCAAKRYLYFFTGVDVPLFDPGDINKPGTTSDDDLAIEYIKSLGKELKSSQSQEKLIRKIISSELFLSK